MHVKMAEHISSIFCDPSEGLCHGKNDNFFKNFRNQTFRNCTVFFIIPGIHVFRAADEIYHFVGVEYL